MSNITLFQHIFICFCYHLSLQLKWSNVSAITCHFSVMSFSLWLIDHISCQAINCYTKAHNIKPCHPVILSNRCAAYLRWSLDSNLYAICAACMRHLNLMNTYSNHIFTRLTVICFKLLPGFANSWYKEVHQIPKIYHWVGLILQYMLEYVTFVFVFVFVVVKEFFSNCSTTWQVLTL